MINRYRIFDIEENEYCEEPDYRWFLTRNGKLYNSELDEYYSIGKRYIIEFSTGHFDANGTEIFEGDKFSNDDDDCGYFLIEFDEELSKFVVNVYSHPQHFNQDHSEVISDKISLVDRNYLEVINLTDSVIIGNIHQKI